MINFESPAWPELPPELISVDEQLNAEIAAIPLLGKGVLRPREVEVGELASKDLTVPQTADALYLSIDTVKTHRSRGFKKAGTHAIEALVYRLLDSGLIAYEVDTPGIKALNLSPLPPLESLVLKELALGKSALQMEEERGYITEKEAKNAVGRLGRKLGASLRPGMVKRGYELKLFARHLLQNDAEQPEQTGP